MTKIRKITRRKTYKVSVNRKRLRNKTRKVPNITCSQMKVAWKRNRSARINLLQMGLAYDPNKSLKIHDKNQMIKSGKQALPAEYVEANGSIHEQKWISNEIQVAKTLEDAEAPRERKFKLPKAQVQYMTHLMDKYGEDYKAMSRDKKNYYQLTWRQIKSRINTFKKNPDQYAEYLVKTGAIILENSETIQETKQKIAQTNLEKYCTPQILKKHKSTINQWLEESIEYEMPDRFNNLNTFHNNYNYANLLGQAGKKFDLFVDDENDNNNKEHELN